MTTGSSVLSSKVVTIGCTGLNYSRKWCCTTVPFCSGLAQMSEPREPAEIWQKKKGSLKKKYLSRPELSVKRGPRRHHRIRYGKHSKLRSENAGKERGGIYRTDD